MIPSFSKAGHCKRGGRKRIFNKKLVVCSVLISMGQAQQTRTINSLPILKRVVS